MKITALVFSLLLIPTFSFAGSKFPVKLRANVPQICTTGSVPSTYMGKYIVMQDGKSINIEIKNDTAVLTLDQQTVVANLKSCVVQGIRLVTASIGSDYINLITFVSLDSKKIFVTLLTETPQNTSPNTLIEIISRTHQNVMSDVLQGK